MNATLQSVVRETSDISTFIFKTERPLRYIAGQFIELTLVHGEPDDRGTKRWFTLSSAPGHETISITTKLATKPSTFKSHLWELKPGGTVDISEPMGDFVLPKDPSIPLVFVAGGIGITPFHSIIQWLVDTNQSRNIQCIYSVNNETELLFAETLQRAFVSVNIRINQPNLTADEIVTVVNGLKEKQLYVSGPEPMTESIVEQFKRQGYTQDQLITDYFPGYSSI